MLDILKIKINDQEKTLRPSIKALRNIEESLKIGVGEIGQIMSTGKISLDLIVETLYYGLEAGGNTVSRTDIESALEQDGLDCFNEAIVGFFLQGTLGAKRASEVLEQLKASKESA